jgi:hypothetical protein
MMWCTCWHAGAASRDLGARDTRTSMVSQHTRAAFQAVENSCGYRSDNRPDAVQITGHPRSNLLQTKWLLI